MLEEYSRHEWQTIEKSEREKGNGVCSEWDGTGSGRNEAVNPLGAECVAILWVLAWQRLTFGVTESREASLAV